MASPWLNVVLQTLYRPMDQLRPGDTSAHTNTKGRVWIDADVH